jgi:hypothetical protein
LIFGSFVHIYGGFEYLIRSDQKIRLPEYLFHKRRDAQDRQREAVTASGPAHATRQAISLGWGARYSVTKSRFEATLAYGTEAETQKAMATANAAVQTSIVSIEN